jgi:predicted double-glycine peptidase
MNEVVPPSKITKHRLIMRSSDFGCGPASLATILKYSFNENATEETVMQGMLTYGEIEKITQRKAFSLLDMKKYLEAIGYTGTGYKIVAGISLSQLQNDNSDSIAQVSITPIEMAGIKRFVVFRGYDQNNIYLGDPSIGNICMSIHDYAGVICDNIIFVVGRNDSSQEESFILYGTKPSMRYMKHIDDASMAEIF